MNNTDVRLVGDGETKIVSWSQALTAQEESGCELILTAEATSEQPAVYKLVNRGKEEYLRQKSRKSKNHTQVTKEVEFRAAIAESDFDRKVNQIRKFLSRGNKVNAKIVAARDKTVKGLTERAAEFIALLPEDIKAHVPDNISPGVRSISVAMSNK